MDGGGGWSKWIFLLWIQIPNLLLLLLLYFFFFGGGGVEKVIFYKESKS